jgi:hypothetical protein
MTKLRFVIDLPDADLSDHDSVRRRFAPLIISLEALTEINEWHLREALTRGKPYPRLYKSGVYYEEEPPGQEDWLDLPSLYKAGKGDCEDLGCVLAAERRVYDGLDARPVIKVKFVPSEELRAAGYPRKAIPRDGIFLVHVLTLLPNGIIEDPSKVLGMRGDFS